MSGFVYFIACGDRVKIGYSVDPAKRLTKINADAPMSCELLGFVSATDFPEQELHDRFAAVRLHSEWFALTAEIKAFIATASVGARIGGDRFDREDLSDATPLKRWRVLQKLTQRDAAAQAGAHVAHWNKWELGKARIPAAHCLAIARLTGISVHDLRPDIYGPKSEAAA